MTMPLNMLKEIYQQPNTLRNTIEENKDLITRLAKKFHLLNRIYYVGSGTSYHASLLGQLLLSKFCSIPVTAIPSSEFEYWTPSRFEKETLLIAISQSGESIDTLRAIKTGKSKGSSVLAITNSPGSTLSKESDYTIVTHAGKEKAITATKSYTAQLAIIYLLSFGIGDTVQSTLVTDAKSSLFALPSIIEHSMESMERRSKILAEKYKSFKFFFLLGSDLNYPTALEGALKLKEACNLYAEGFATREFLHGPVQLVNDNTCTLIFTSNTWDELVTHISQEIRKYGSRIIGFVKKSEISDAGVSDWMTSNIKVNSLVTPVIYIISIQLFAYYSSIFRGLNPDKPDKLHKVVDK